MKISPIGGPSAMVGAVAMENTSQPTMSQRIRSLKMTTNRTPGYVRDPDPTEVGNTPTPGQPQGGNPTPVGISQGTAELPISPTSSDTATAAPEETQPLSPQLAALAREKRALQVKERAFADKEKAFAEKMAQGGQGIPKEQLISNPIGTLLELGLTWEQMTDAVLKHQQGHNPDVDSLKQKVQELEQGFDKKLTDRDVRQKQEALQAIEREAQGLIAEGEEFELVRETRRLPDVMRLIEKTYDDTGEVLSTKEALGLVEAELLEEATKLATLKKIQQRTSPAPVTPGATLPQRGMRTLTNRDTASVPMDRRARALAAFQGTLKK